MPNRLLLGALVVVGTAGATPAPAAEPHPTIDVRVEDRANLSERTLSEAEKVAAGVYRRGGVDVRWSGGPTEGDLAIVRLVIIPDATQLATKLSDDSMGVALNRDGVRTHVAFVFYDRVQRFATAGGVDVQTVLGAVMAHELGHLLLPINAHSRDGVMRGRWDSRFVPRAGTGVLNFLPEQARLLRARLATRDSP